MYMNICICRTHHRQNFYKTNCCLFGGSVCCGRNSRMWQWLLEMRPRTQVVQGAKGPGN